MAHFGDTNPYVALLKREEKFKNIEKLQDKSFARVTSILKYFDEEDL